MHIKNLNRLSNLFALLIPVTAILGFVFLPKHIDGNIVSVFFIGSIVTAFFLKHQVRKIDRKCDYSLLIIAVIIAVAALASI